MAEVSVRALWAVAGTRVRTGPALIARIVNREVLYFRVVEARHILRRNNTPRASVGNLNTDPDLERAGRYVERNRL